MEHCIIIPTYREELNIEATLLELFDEIPEIDKFVIVDDSPNNLTKKVVENISRKFGNKEVVLIGSSSKSGRGFAVRQGMSWAIEHFTSCSHFIEMDADGSHNAQMVRRLMLQDSKLDFIISSRYLPKSNIFGWPKKRKYFSIVINLFLRLLFRYPVSDWTNGLRRYSKKSTNFLLSATIQNSGFIYLSEQILLLRKMGVPATEIPIDFFDRSKGSSSVTRRELFAALCAVVNLFYTYGTKRKLKNSISQ